MNISASWREKNIYLLEHEAEESFEIGSANCDKNCGSVLQQCKTALWCKDKNILRQSLPIATLVLAHSHPHNSTVSEKAD